MTILINKVIHIYGMIIHVLIFLFFPSCAQLFSLSDLFQYSTSG